MKRILRWLFHKWDRPVLGAPVVWPHGEGPMRLRERGVRVLGVQVRWNYLAVLE